MLDRHLVLTCIRTVSLVRPPRMGLTQRMPPRAQGKGGRTRGKQVYLGGWLTEEAAAHAYDLAAIRFWGADAVLNARPPASLQAS